jgi:hypothetical protein
VTGALSRGSGEDVVATNGRQPVAIVCDLHPEGIDAHIDRHLALIRSGWCTIDAMRSPWDERRPELVVELAQRLRPAFEPPPRAG